MKVPIIPTCARRLRAVCSDYGLCNRQVRRIPCGRCHGEKAGFGGTGRDAQRAAGRASCRFGRECSEARMAGRKLTHRRVGGTGEKRHNQRKSLQSGDPISIVFFAPCYRYHNAGPPLITWRSEGRFWLVMGIRECRATTGLERGPRFSVMDIFLLGARG